MLDCVIVHTDGASKGNPGQAAIGAHIEDEQGKRLATISERIGRATNNQAEYRAVIAALERAIALGARRVEIFSDSELVVKHLRGEYRVKDSGLKPLFETVNGLRARLPEFAIYYVPREDNSEADALANAAFRAGPTPGPAAPFPASPGRQGLRQSRMWPRG